MACRIWLNHFFAIVILHPQQHIEQNLNGPETQGNLNTYISENPFCGMLEEQLSRSDIVIFDEWLGDHYTPIPVRNKLYQPLLEVTIVP